MYKKAINISLLYLLSFSAFGMTEDEKLLFYKALHESAYKTVQVTNHYNGREYCSSNFKEDEKFVYVKENILNAQDPWGEEYQINEECYIYSKGPDKEAGTNDDLVPYITAIKKAEVVFKENEERRRLIEVQRGLRNIEVAINRYKIGYGGDCPSDLKELRWFFEVDGVWIDPWGNDYEYDEKECKPYSQGPNLETQKDDIYFSHTSKED